MVLSYYNAAATTGIPTTILTFRIKFFLHILIMNEFDWVTFGELSRAGMTKQYSRPFPLDQLTTAKLNTEIIIRHKIFNFIVRKKTFKLSI